MTEEIIKLDRLIERTCTRCGTVVANRYDSFWCECKDTFFLGEIKKMPVGNPPRIDSPRDEHAFLNAFRKANPDWKH